MRTPLRRWSRRLLLCALAVCAALAVTSRAWAAEDAGGVSIEWAYLATYPEADCTKIHLYVKNTSKFPVFLEGIHLGDRFLDLDLDRQDALSMAEANVAATDADHTVHDERAGRFSRTPGSLQWHRALPNPVEPDSITDVTVSLWGTVKEASIRIPVRGGGQLQWDAREQKRALRLSHIAFDPADPNKIYVYCENKTDKDIAIDHILVNTERVAISKSIPTGNAIEAGKKTCFIVYPKQEMIWGRYAGVGVVGKGGEKIVAVVRVINFFPIGSWSVDTRPEMFFDAVDLRSPPLKNKGTSGQKYRFDVLVGEMSERPYQAHYDGADPTCAEGSAEENAMALVLVLSALLHKHPQMPFYTHICRPMQQNFALFGELADLVFVNPYTILFRAEGPAESGKFLKLAREWIDPRPILSIPEAFTDSKHLYRDLTPDEVCFALWNEIGQGAKGVRYFTRHVASPGKGYSEMPGLQAEIARQNLNLQLIKGFLRVGDTFGSSPVTNHEGIVGKTLLCGDKGIVLVLLNHNYRGKRKTASQWMPIRDLYVSLKIPQGYRAERLFALDGGLSEAEFAKSEKENVSFVIPTIDTNRVYLLLFARRTFSSGGCHRGDEPQKRTGTSTRHSVSRGVDSISALHNSYISQVATLASVLLIPDVHLSDDQAVSTGMRLESAKTGLLRELSHVEEAVAQWSPEGRISVFYSVARVYGHLGLYQAANKMAHRMVASLPVEMRVEIWRSLAEICVADGEYDIAATALERALDCTEERTGRRHILEMLVEIHENKLGNLDLAAQWASVLVAACAYNVEMSANARIHLAKLLIKDKKPREAVIHLQAIDSQLRDRLGVDHLLGVACVAANDFGEALAYLTRSEATNQSNADEIMFLTGYALMMLGEEDEAREQLLNVIRRLPNSEYATRAKRLMTQIADKEKTR